MIQTALSFLRGVLDDYILLKDPFKSAGAPLQKVVLDNIVSQDNKLTHSGGNFLFMTLVNTEEETVGKSQLPYFKTPDDKLNILNPDIKLNLYIQFSGFSDSDTGSLTPYEKSLKLVDQVIFFFQYRNVFSGNQFSVLMDGGIDKLIIEPVSLTFEQLNHMWATLGAKYLPSIIYKCRTLSYREMVVSPEQPLIKELQSDESSKV